MRDVGMIQRGEDLRFAMKPREPIGVAGERVGKHLDRDIAIQTRVAGAVDLTHPARPERVQDLVHADAGAGGE